MPVTSLRRAVVLLEACVSIMLIGIVLGMVSLHLTHYARATDYYLNYQRAQLAAESCVERMRAGVLEVTDAAFTDEAGVGYEIRVDGDIKAWEPLRLVRITAVVVGKHSRQARYELTAFVAYGTVGEGGGQ